MSTIKLFDFDKKFNKNSMFGKNRNLAWPVALYRVTLPSFVSNNAEMQINPFERYVLNMLNIERFIDIDDFSEKTCIDKDLLNGLLMHLFDKGYIDSNYNFIDNEIVSSLNKNQKQVAVVFRELVGGSLLPYLYVLKHDNQIENKIIDLEATKIKVLERSNKEFEDVKPAEILDIVKRMKRKARSYGGRVDIPRIEQVCISMREDNYFLDCPIILEDDLEYRIVSPIDQQYSLELESVFAELIRTNKNWETWLLKWKDMVVDSKSIAKPLQKKSSKFTSDNNNKYPYLITSLENDIEGSYDIYDIYSAIEWSFYYSNKYYDDNIVKNILKTQSQRETKEMLSTYVGNIGFELPETGIKIPNKGNIDGYFNGTSNLNCALAISLHHANNDSKHPLWFIAKKCPDLIKRLYLIKEERDMKGHGSGQGRDLQISGSNNYLMKLLVSSLLPDVKFGEIINEGINDKAYSNYMEIRFLARTELQKVFGVSYFNLEFSEITQSNLIDAQIAYYDNRHVKPLRGGVKDYKTLLNNLYASLQNELYREIDIKYFDKNRLKDSYIEEFNKILEKFEFGGVGNGLLKTSDHYISQSLSGSENSTLGGIVIAYALCCGDSKMKFISDVYKDFFADIESVISMRGHAGKPVLITESMAIKYKEKVFKILKTLKEA